MRKLCQTLASMEDAMIALERRGISLRAHAERMDTETGRMPVFHLDMGTEDHWFVSRDQLDEFVSARKLSMDEADAPQTESDSQSTLPKISNNGDESSNGTKVAHAPHVIELFEVRTINAGLKELTEFGFTIEDLIPKDRTGRTDARFRLLREENEVGLEDLRGLLPAIRAAGEKGLQITRFKGLGEMNAEELRETTLDPAVRSMIKVTLTDAAAADEMFRVLMGDKVEPRREFIEKHALDVKNLDV